LCGKRTPPAVILKKLKGNFFLFIVHEHVKRVNGRNLRLSDKKLAAILINRHILLTDICYTDIIRPIPAVAEKTPGICGGQYQCGQET
jgi:hypothetical protein